MRILIWAAWAYGAALPLAAPKALAQSTMGVTTDAPSPTSSGAAASRAPEDDAGGGEEPSATPYVRQVQAGMELLLRGDQAGALELFAGLAAEHPRHPEGSFYQGVAHRMAGRPEEALEAFRLCAGANPREQPRWTARALFAIADTLEQLDGRLAEAKNAWNAYAEFADRNLSVADPTIGRSRLQMIDRALALESSYQSVRQRIAERERAARRPRNRRRR